MLIPNADPATIDPPKLRDSVGVVVSVWFIPAGGDVPRFVTAYRRDGLCFHTHPEHGMQPTAASAIMTPPRLSERR